MLVEAYAAIHCLAATIFWEARNEPPDGMYAVGYVVLNRVKDDRWPDDVCSVVYQPYQFTWVKNPQQVDESNPLELRAWRRSQDIAAYLLDQHDGALFRADHYHHVDVWPLPDWVRGMKPYAKIGNHVFYRSEEW